MKIAIDISQIVYGTGVSIYTKKLVESLLTIDKENEYILFAGAFRRREEILQSFSQTRAFPIPPTLADIIWNKLHILPIEKLIGDVDVLHTSDWTEPPSKAFKVTTVHDLYPFKFPKLVNPKIMNVHRRKMSWVLQESDRIIVPSNSTNNDLVEIGADPEKIRIIPEAPSMSKAGEAETQRVRRKYNLREDYLISIGITPLKNTKRIIEAFHLSKAGKGIKLVLVGRPNHIQIEHERDIRILGHVPQEDLSALLSDARALVFASLYEGFGIPILDAFACGTPVVTSNAASMPEVAGGAAELVDPQNTNSIAEGISKVLKGRKGFIDRGFKRVQEFSWKKSASMTLDVYKEAKK